MDIESALSQLNDMLENEETNEKFKSLVDIISNSGLGEGSSDSSNESKPKPSNSNSNSLVNILSLLGNSSEEKTTKKSNSGGGLGDLSGILGTASKLFSNSKVSNEQRIALLDAIEPFLKDERREKVQTCKKVLKLAGVLTLLETLDL